MWELESKLSLKQKRVISIIIIAAVLLFIVLICVVVGKPMIEFVNSPEKFREWVDEKGLFGKIAFVGMLVFQTVFAVVPGEPFEIGAGYAFGAFWGTVLCVIGFTIGSLIIFALVRTLGIRIVEIFFPLERIRSMRFLQNTKRLNILTFIIFLIPGTPKDFIAYFVGLTDIKLSVWIFIASAARLPSIITSTIGGSALGGEKYITAIVVFAIALAVSGIGLIIYKYISKRHSEK